MGSGFHNLWMDELRDRGFTICGWMSCGIGVSQSVDG